MPYFENNGHKLHYQEKGTGDLLIILPGNTASSSSHLDDLDYFGQYYHTVSLDFWGTGKSERLKDWTRNWWLDAARDTAKLIEHLHYAHAHIIGCSGGAAVGLLMAALYPEKAHSIIADSELRQYQTELITLCLEDRNRKSPEQIAFWQNAHGSDWESIILEDNKLMLDLAHNGHLFSDKLPDITCPVLFCGSLTEDSYVPNFSSTLLQMTKEAKRAELLLINAGDHPLMWTCKQQFRSMACSFIMSLS